MQRTNDLIQWVGTAFILVMYAVMNFFPEYRLANILTGLGGAICFFAWAYRVANKQQMIINGVAIFLCVSGVYKYFG